MKESFTIFLFQRENINHILPRDLPASTNVILLLWVEFSVSDSVLTLKNMASDVQQKSLSNCASSHSTFPIQNTFFSSTHCLYFDLERKPWRMNLPGLKSLPHLIIPSNMERINLLKFSKSVSVWKYSPPFH